MSLKTVRLSFLSLKPKLWVENDVLYGRLSLFVQALSLYACSRSLRVDPIRRVVELDVRRFWVSRTFRSIPFDEVHYIDYDFQSWGTSWGMCGGMSYGELERTDQVERFTVNLVLKNRETVSLFSFAGEGSCETGWRGVLLYGDRIFDFAGDQDLASKDFVDLLQKMLGVSIGEPYKHLADKDGHKRCCASCGRPAGPASRKCLYCGGEVCIPGKETPKLAQARSCPSCGRKIHSGRTKCMYCGASISG